MVITKNDISRYLVPTIITKTMTTTREEVIARFKEVYPGVDYNPFERAYDSLVRDGQITMNELYELVYEVRPTPRYMFAALVSSYGSGDTFNIIDLSKMYRDILSGYLTSEHSKKFWDEVRYIVYGEYMYTCALRGELPLRWGM